MIKNLRYFKFSKIGDSSLSIISHNLPGVAIIISGLYLFKIFNCFTLAKPPNTFAIFIL